MDGWKYWEGKRIYIILKSNRRYSGEVLEVSQEHNGICWITILDKYNKRISFVNSEIELIQEENEL